MTDLLTYTVSGKADWSLIPGYMIGGLRRYIENGIEPGSFLSNLLCNNLKRTFECADDVNSNCVRSYVQFLYNYAPSDCWGSEEHYATWIKKGGLGFKEFAP
jgi:hypothetical protein